MFSELDLFSTELSPAEVLAGPDLRGGGGVGGRAGEGQRGDGRGETIPSAALSPPE